MIAGGALGARVKDGFAIDQEAVMMLPMIERQRKQPGTVRLAFHRVSGRVPIVEIADQMDAVGLGGNADKTDRFGDGPGGMAVT